MKFTLGIPLGVITPGEFQSIVAIQEMTTALERAGVDACYVTDHPAPWSEWLHANGHDAIDPFTALAFVAAASTKLRLHTNVIVVPYRNPFLIAKAAATLQVLSGGRLILGLGAGYQKQEFDALGVDMRERGALLDEGLEVLRLAWAGGAVVKQGRHFNAPGNEPRPVPNPPPRVWVGGGSDKAVARAARAGDGWSPVLTSQMAAHMTESQVKDVLKQGGGIGSVPQLADKIAQIKAVRAKAGCTGEFDIAVATPTALPSTAKALTRAVREQFLQEAGELARVGVTWVQAKPPYHSRVEFLEAVQWFGEEIIARMRS